MEGRAVWLCAKSPVALLVGSSSSSLHKGIPREWGPKPVAQRTKQGLALLQPSGDNRAAQTLWLFSPSRVALRGAVRQPSLASLSLGSSQILVYLLTDPHLCPDLKRYLFQHVSLLF